MRDMHNTDLPLVISLHQPYASFVVHRLKQIETRHWSTKVRGRVIIHAAAGMPAYVRPLLDKKEFQHGLVCVAADSVELRGLSFEDIYKKLPRGEAVGEVNFTDCRPTELVRDGLTKQELAFGCYDDDRFAIMMDSVKRYNPPIPMRGFQKFWRLKPEFKGAVFAASTLAKWMI